MGAVVEIYGRFDLVGTVAGLVLSSGKERFALLRGLPVVMGTGAENYRLCS